MQGVLIYIKKYRATAYLLIAIGALFIVATAAVAQISRAESRELLAAIPSNDEILERGLGEDDYERSIYAAAAFKVLLDTSNTLIGPRDNWSALEHRLNERLRAGLSEAMEGRPRGRWFREFWAAEDNYREDIFHRYWPEYVDYQATLGRTIGVPNPDNRPSLIEEAPISGPIITDALVELFEVFGGVIVFFMVVALLAGWRPFSKQEGRKSRSVLVILLSVAGGFMIILAVDLENPLGLITAFILLIVVIFVSRSASHARAPTRRERNQEVLRACTGMTQEEFDKSDQAHRHIAILQWFASDNNDITVHAEFRHKQGSIGTQEGRLGVTLKPFVVRRAIGAMGAAGVFLKVNTLLYNMDLIEDMTFDVRSWSLLNQDNLATLHRWEGWHAHGISVNAETATDVFHWIMRQRYTTVNAAIEGTRIDLGRFEKGQPENVAVQAALRAV